MELYATVRARRMVRNFSDRAVEAHQLERMLDAARRAPTAGNCQGVEFLVLAGAPQTERFWAATFTPETRAAFRWQGLFRAPVLVLPVGRRDRYLARYAEPDKARTPLAIGSGAIGSGAAGSEAAAHWPVPYWLTDAAMAAEHLLLAATAEGLGALFFGIFRGRDRVQASFGIPDDAVPVGVVALGHPEAGPPGRSSSRPRRPLDEVVHRGHW